jgi:hypothetical protein
MATAAFCTIIAAGVALANTVFLVPEDGTPPFYHSVGGPFFPGDGSVFALNDGKWAVLPFYRDPDFPADEHDLINDFDENVFDASLFITGTFTLTDDGQLFATTAQGTAVPVWFVKWKDLQKALGDGRLQMGELRAMKSLIKGTASSYSDDNQVFGVAPVSRLNLRAEGTLEDGRSFRVHFVEENLELLTAEVDFGKKP